MSDKRLVLSLQSLIIVFYRFYSGLELFNLLCKDLLGTQFLL